MNLVVDIRKGLIVFVYRFTDLILRPLYSKVSSTTERLIVVEVTRLSLPKVNENKSFRYWAGTLVGEL